MARILGLAILAISLVACSDERFDNLDAPKKFFSKTKVGISADYGIIKMGNPDDHVVTVHGFVDDQASCKEIADALNVNACKELDGQNCLDPYSCIRLNQ